MEPITAFRGEHGWLSNFHQGSPFLWNGHSWPTAEHAYQASKAINVTDYQLVKSQGTPAAAKQAGRKIACRPDWDAVRREIMLHILLAKFTDPQLRAQLAATGDAVLVEGNTWGDTFWGVVTYDGREDRWKTKLPIWQTSDPHVVLAGHNWLGRELMMVREVLS